MIGAREERDPYLSSKNRDSAVLCNHEEQTVPQQNSRKKHGHRRFVARLLIGSRFFSRREDSRGKDVVPRKKKEQRKHESPKKANGQTPHMYKRHAFKT